MSAAASQLDGTSQRTSVLPFPSPTSTTSLEQILSQLGTLEPQVITEIELLNDEGLFQLWGRLKQLERYAWFGKCACCARIWNKTEAAKRGRGNKDIPRKGILAAVSRVSKKFDITPSTVYLNKRIFNLIQQVTSTTNSYTQQNILEVLDEKGYWEHALNAADPLKAVRVFCEKKATERRFRVTDAERLVLSPEMSRQAVALKAVEQARESAGQLTERQTLISHIRGAQDIIRNLIMPGCPDNEFKARVWEELLLELDDEYQELFDEDAYVLLRAAWDKGNTREDQLAEATKIPLETVSHLMGALANMSEFIRVQSRDMTKRSQFQLWHKVGAPFDNAALMPMPSGRR